MLNLNPTYFQLLQPLRLAVLRTVGWGLLTCMALFAFSCTNDLDEDPPEITIAQPTANSSFSALSTVRVQAKITDESTITKVLVFLADAAKNPVGETVEINTSTSDFDLDIDYEIDDVRLEGGAYFIVVKATANQRAGEASVPIRLEEVELERLGIVVVEGYDFNTAAIRSMDDELIQTRLHRNVSVGSGNTALSSFHQQLYFLDDGGNLRAFNINEDQSNWNENLSGRTPMLDLIDEQIAVRTERGGLQLFQHGGSEIFEVMRREFDTQGIMTRGIQGVFFVVTRPFNGQGDHIIPIEDDQEAIAIQTTYRIHNLFPEDDAHFLMLADDRFGNLVVARFNTNLETTVELYRETLPDEVLSSVQINEHSFLIATREKLLRYDATTNSTNVLLSGKKFELLTFDPLSQELFAVSDLTNIERFSYQPTSLTLLRQTFAENRVRNLHIWYNK